MNINQIHYDFREEKKQSNWKVEGVVVVVVGLVAVVEVVEVVIVEHSGMNYSNAFMNVKNHHIYYYSGPTHRDGRISCGESCCLGLLGCLGGMAGLLDFATLIWVRLQFSYFLYFN